MYIVHMCMVGIVAAVVTFVFRHINTHIEMLTIRKKKITYIQIYIYLDLGENTSITLGRLCVYERGIRTFDFYTNIQ